jgi:hypothetical protein
MKSLLLVAISILSVLSTSAPAADMRIVFWYDRARPLDTFKFQSYDLRKHQYTPEVERWATMTRQKYPGFEVYTRDVDLTREVGQTDNLKIGSAITREFMVLGARHGPTGTATSPAWSPFPVPYPRPHP